MTQIVHSNNRETRTKRIACVSRLMRIRSERISARFGLEGATGAVATLTERYYRGFAKNVAGLARGSHSSSVYTGSPLRTQGTAAAAPGRGKIVRWPMLTYAPAAKRTLIAPMASAGWRWWTAAANEGHWSSPP